jgi:hypothetical protein
MDAREKHNRKMLKALGPVADITDWTEIARVLGVPDADTAKRLLVDIAMNPDVWIVGVQDWPPST